MGSREAVCLYSPLAAGRDGTGRWDSLCQAPADTGRAGAGEPGAAVSGGRGRAVGVRARGTWARPVLERGGWGPEGSGTRRGRVRLGLRRPGPGALSRAGPDPLRPEASGHGAAAPGPAGPEVSGPGGLVC